MPALLSLSLFPDFLTKTHLHKTPFPRKILSNFPTIPTRVSISSDSNPPNSSCSLSFLAPLEAILFDIDGTLCDSDPVHYYAFRDMLQEIGFNAGVPITEEFFVKTISGKHNEELSRILLPEWDFQRAMKFMDDKEAMFRRLAAEQLEPVNGLNKLLKWIEDRGLQRAAVTNAPRPNAELLLSMLGLADFFKIVVLASECDRVKPFPDAYLKALQILGASPKCTFVFEVRLMSIIMCFGMNIFIDSVSGIKAGVGAGMLVVGLATRNPEKLLADAGAIFVIKDFDDPKLWTALEKLEK